MSFQSSGRPLYRIPRRESDPLFTIVQAAGSLFLFSCLAIWIATEIVAWKFAFQRALGAPLFPRVYEPWAGLRWQIQFAHANDPRVHQVLGLFWSAWGCGELIALLISVALVVRAFRKEKHSDLHGSAHWATEREVKATGLLEGGAGVYVGALDEGGRTRYLRDDGPEHILAFAPTRSGKGVGLVIPTLLSWPHSTVVHDIKGENFALTSGWRARELGQRVLKFDPASNDGSSCRFNPLAQVRIRTDFEIKDVQNIVQMLVDPDGRGSHGEEAHWIATSSALLVGVILHVLYYERDKTLGGVAEFLSSPGFDSATQLYQYMLNARHGDAESSWIDANGQPTATHPVVAMAARDMLNKDPREATSVHSTAVRFLTLFRDPIVARNTAASDFTVDDLMNADRPISLYLVVPPSDIDRLKPLTRLMLNQILRGLTAEMRFSEGRDVPHYRHRLLLMIDELPSLGRLDILQTALAFMAGYGIKAYLIAQDVAQLYAAYGGASGRDETIMANCHLQIAFAPNRIETMELLSKLAGMTTVRSESRSYSGARVGMRAHVMVNAQDSERALLTPDEARRLPETDELIFVTGHAPIYAKKIRYFEDRTFAERAKIAPAVTEAGVESMAAQHA